MPEVVSEQVFGVLPAQVLLVPMSLIQSQEKGVACPLHLQLELEFSRERVSPQRFSQRVHHKWLLVILSGEKRAYSACESLLLLIKW